MKRVEFKREFKYSPYAGARTVVCRKGEKRDVPNDIAEIAYTGGFLKRKPVAVKRKPARNAATKPGRQG